MLFSATAAAGPNDAACAVPALLGGGDWAPAGKDALRAIAPFIDGVTLALWAWATWWIPLLLLLGVWKHGVHRTPLRYTTALWSMVFPLGMYAVASHRLFLVAEIAALQALPRAMAWIALAAWSATAVALVVACWRSAGTFLREARSQTPAGGR